MKKIRTLGQLQREAKNGTFLRHWRVCIDSGGHHLRYIGPNKPGQEPREPFQLDLTVSPWELLVEALTLLGIPAEQA